MILQSMQGWEQEQHLYPQAIRRGVQYLIETDFGALADGKYEIDGDRMFAMLMTIENEPAEARKPESHSIYTDIQYVIDGDEVMGAAKTSAAHSVSERNEEKDLILYSHVEDESFVLVKPGMFTIFYPSDIHRPCCKASSASTRKAVIKIHRDLLQA